MIRPEDLEMALKLANPMDMTEQVAYHVWAAVATATKAFGKVTVKIDGRNCRIYLCVTLRWWAKAKKMEPLRKVWLKRAENRAAGLIPNGWRHLIYYEQSDGHRHDFKGSGTGNAVDSGNAV